MAECATSREVGDCGGVGRTLAGEGERYFMLIGRAGTSERGALIVGED